MNIVESKMKEKNKSIKGFSKLSKKEKIKWISTNFFTSEDISKELVSFWHPDEAQQKIIDGFSENTLSNFVMPYGVAPNFHINDKIYCVPMVIEESSVVAAASSAAKFWAERGGFQVSVEEMQKVGQVHFTFKGDFHLLQNDFNIIQEQFLIDTQHITANMRKRGGGVLSMELLDMSHLEEDYYQIKVTFDTCDSMGANFINSVLEEMARSLLRYVANTDWDIKDIQIIMAILSNYTPDCVARAKVSCPITALGNFGEMNAATFAQKFSKAVKIAQIDPFRAATHNKGIFNGIDAVVIATANDFRAIESCGHSYASRDGQYRSLSYCTIKDGIFEFGLDIPLALGTVGGLTQLHPMAAFSLALLGKPSAKELMCITAAVGLAQNFAALRSLVTTGIQKGHMKMHLMNILNHLNSSPQEIEKTCHYFENKVVSFSAVRDYVDGLRVNSLS